MSLQSCLTALLSRLPGESVVISPGSRNAALIRTFVDLDFDCHSVVDERSAGFYALGMAQATGSPVILCCTSGTAALNYYPAIAEAFYARIPLIVLTADRPPESIDQWDGQAIRQKGVFDQHVRASWQSPIDFTNEADFASLGNELIGHFKEHPIPGPVHVNVPIPEPFYEKEPSPKAQKTETQSFGGFELSADDLRQFLGMKAGEKLLVFNAHPHPGSVGISSDEDEDSLVLSELSSGMYSDLAYWDAMFFSSIGKLDSFAALQADVLVTTGTTTVSKGLKLLLRSWNIERHYHVSSDKEIGKMFGSNPVQISVDEVVHAFVKELKEQDEELIEQEPAYLSQWKELQDAFIARLEALDWDAWTEFGAMRAVMDHLQEELVHFGNSMPVRYASYLNNGNAHFFFANRGTSGIDGCLSTAVGHATCVEDPVFVVLGDVSFFYDINALWNRNLPQNLKIIVLNNKGGQIFRYLEGPSKFEHAFPFQLTEQEREIKGICEHFGLGYFCAQNYQELEKNWDEFSNNASINLLEIRTDPELNHVFYQKFKQLNNE